MKVKYRVHHAFCGTNIMDCDLIVSNNIGDLENGRNQGD